MGHTATDSYPTATTVEQRRTEDILVQHRPPDDQPKPQLNRQTHLQFLARNLLQGFPAKVIGQDASQPWLVFWTVASLYLLGVGLDPQNKQKIIDTIMRFQQPSGGFGGGPGQFAHLLPTYASVCTLAMVGRPGPNGGWDQIDRENMYDFFMSLKQPDGSFLVAHHSEVDVRGTYCLLCVAILLNLVTPELIAGTGEFIASLQTYEGGFASASHPYYSSTPGTAETLLPSPRPALGEAHGGYTFCALASWTMLKPFLPKDRSYDVNIKRLLRWLVHMQGSKEELGGFRGRTNKLVDICYSWWQGGCFQLLRALGVGPELPSEHISAPVVSQDGAKSEEAEWSDVDDSLFDRFALQEYILYAGQFNSGGLRDKPPKNPDAYHTLYALSGLATSQHEVHQVQEKREDFKKEWKLTGVNPELDSMRRSAYIEARCWTEQEGLSKYVNGPGDRVNAMHPIFNLTMTHSAEILKHFYQQN